MAPASQQNACLRDYSAILPIDTEETAAWMEPG